MKNNLNDKLLNAVFHEEHGTITLRTPKGWLLCNLGDKRIETLGDLIEIVEFNLRSYKDS
jgi:hypothetical protein